MIPIRDTLHPQKTPWVNRTLFTLNLVVFAIQFFSGRRGEILIQIFGMIPARLFDPSRFHYSWPEAAFTLVTSLFLHGGFVHLAGNLVYLWIFGDDVEEHVGHAAYAVFYLTCGAAGSVMHSVLFAASTVPSIGASGSIAGVLGAFLLIYPRARIVTLVPLVVSWVILEIPAVVFLPIWFAMQFLNGWMSLAAAQQSQAAGVAWWAHIGGFSCGVIAALFVFGRRSREAASVPPPS